MSVWKQVKTSCGCFFKNSAVIVGYLSLIVGICSSYITIVSLINIEQAKHPHISDAASVMIIMSLRICQMLLSILLIIGAYQDRSSFMCPWLAVSVLLVFIEAIYGGLSLLQWTSNRVDSQLCSLGLHISLTTYFVSVVYSRYNELRQRRTNYDSENQQKITDIRYSASSTSLNYI